LEIGGEGLVKREEEVERIEDFGRVGFGEFHFSS